MASLNPFSLLRVSINVRALTAINNSIPRIRTATFVPVYHFPLHLSRYKIDLVLARSISRVSATNDEEANARIAAGTADTGAPTIFDKIIAKEIPSTIVYEDEKVLAFRDINPQAPVHVVLIPKSRDGLTELSKAEARHRDILGELLYAAKVVAEKEGILDGFRVVINNGPTACQSVYHLHLHVLGGRQMKWPPG